MALVLSSAAAAALFDITLLTGPIIGLVLYDSKEYLEKGKLIDVIPHSDIKSRALVESTGLGDLNGVDGVLIGTSTAALSMILAGGPIVKTVGAATLISSYIAGKDRTNAKVIALTSSAAAAIVTNPFKAIATMINLGGVAANTTINGITAAAQISTSAIGVIVTLSGAVVGYFLIKDD